MKPVDSDGYQFIFSDAIAAFKFDSKDKNDSDYHGAPMKAVDVIAEFANAYVFIEIKNFENVERYDENTAINPAGRRMKNRALNSLKEELKYKYRDSFLYRYAESKTDKPTHYICILNLSPSLLYGLEKLLSKELPVGLAGSRWKVSLADSCIVINESMFNSEFPKWSIRRL
ncbi:MAG: hypothetical protein PHC50_01725 [Candidatus Cloacimonetes bacterium]|nr:hypothetical protein [Candidatus Cloacimonadota bacterium]